MLITGQKVVFVLSLVLSRTQAKLSIDDRHELLYHVGGASYFSPTETPLHTLCLSKDASLGTDPRPLTAVPLSMDGSVDAGDIRAAITSYLSADDVLTTDWLEALLLFPSSESSSNGATIGGEVLAALHEQYGVSALFLDPSITLSSAGSSVTTYTLCSTPKAATPGPLLAIPGEGKLDLYPVYALYSDIYRTFLYGVYPRTGTVGGEYKTFRKLDSLGYNLIPVPSRLYAAGDDNGVRGRRIGVKDLYHLTGVPTNAGSRAYGELYGPSSTTAYAVQRLEELGGVIVGKTKTAAFAAGSEGNGDTYDEQYPFSARSDLWQTCVGSSSGSGCAMGAYEWLDFALGTDTGGSVRGPASYVGLYGNRPSRGAISTEGVVPLSNHSDTLGVLSRDPWGFSKFIKAWYAESELEFREYEAVPKRMLVDGKYLNASTPDAEVVIERFVTGVRDRLGIEVVSSDLDATIAEGGCTWSSFVGDGAGYLASNLWWSWTQVGQKFRQDYAEQNDGREPPVDHDARENWNAAEAKGSWELYHQGVAEATQFGHWFNSQILVPDAESCSQNIYLYGIGIGGEPQYREADLNKITFGAGISGGLACSLAGCVDISVPIGQAQYTSPISKITEQKVVSVSLVAHPGCDFALLSLIEKMADAGLLQTVSTGRTAF